MSRILTTIAAVLLAFPFTLSAFPVRTYQDGLNKVGNDKPLVVFCYGANFDKVGPEMYNKYIKKTNHALGRVLSKETYVVVPVFQMPTEAEKREHEKVMGKHRLPGGIWSFPCLAVVDGKGNFRGAVQSSEELKDPDTAAAALSSLLADFRRQQKLLDESERHKGANKTKLLREALSISSVRVPGHKSVDPANDGLGEKLQVMDLERANAHVRNLIASNNYTLLERQMILVAYAGHMRRNNGSVARLRAIYTEIRNIDPKSIYGLYAMGAIQLWVEPQEKDKGAE